MTPIIDIIIPVYNKKKYLPQCIRSIQKQTFSDWNLILVDDGSTDGSASICDKFAAADSRISVIHQENKGLIGARKTGIANASSEFLAFVDADDLAEPEMLEKLWDTQVKYSADIVSCGLKTLSSKGWIKRNQHTNPGSVTLASGKEESVCMASATVSVSMSGKLYRRNVFQKAQNILDTVPNVFYGEDSMINAAVFSKTDKVVRLSDELYDYRVGGFSSGSSEKTIRELAELYQWRKRFLINANADDRHHKANLAQVLNLAIYYAHYSKKLLSRERLCAELAYPIADIEDICPSYRYKDAYNPNVSMTDKEFKNIYHESPLVVIKQYIMRIF